LEIVLVKFDSVLTASLEIKLIHITATMVRADHILLISGEVKYGNWTLVKNGSPRIPNAGLLYDWGQLPCDVVQIILKFHEANTLDYWVQGYEDFTEDMCGAVLRGYGRWGAAWTTTGWAQVIRTPVRYHDTHFPNYHQEFMNLCVKGALKEFTYHCRIACGGRACSAAARHRVRDRCDQRQLLKKEICVKPSITKMWDRVRGWNVTPLSLHELRWRTWCSAREEKAHKKEQERLLAVDRTLHYLKEDLKMLMDRRRTIGLFNPTTKEFLELKDQYWPLPPRRSPRNATPDVWPRGGLTPDERCRMIQDANQIISRYS